MKPLPNWHRDDNSVVACTEKIKVMTDNFEEIHQMMQDAFEDGLLLEVSNTQMHETLSLIVEQLVNPYQTISKMMKLPRDTSLPFFAYGIFKPTEISHFQIKDFVKSTTEITIKGKLSVRDGLPIFDASGQEFVRGSLIHFFHDKQSEAYQRISEMEPDNHYSWEEGQVETQLINILHGKSLNKGADFLDEQKWDSWSDPLFTSALEAIGETLETNSELSHDFKENSKKLFHLQMAYLLLWSSIERYVSLRYRLDGTAATKKVLALAKEEAFRNALLIGVTRTDKVYRADDPTKHSVLDNNNSKKSLEYYYQIRSNITHRGKGINKDFQKVKESLEELLFIFKEVLKSAQNDAL